MAKEKFKNYSKAIIFGVIPSFFLFISKNDFVFNKLKDFKILADTDIPQYQLYFFIIGIFWVSILNSVILADVKNKLSQNNDKFYSIIKFYKKNHFLTVKNELKLQEYTFNTRVFVPSYTPKSIYRKIFFKETILVLKDIFPITDEFDFPKLKFKISPKKVEGMVGRSYQDKKMFIDFDLETQNKYQLSDSQNVLVENTKFCSTMPIFNGKDNVVGVVSIDSDTKVNLDENQTKMWKEYFVRYTAFIDKHFKV